MQARLVTYESCRGLEGWTVVCLELDKLFDQKFRRSDAPADLLTTAEEAAAAQAGSWMMMPATRAIDHLVIHLQGPGHVLAAKIEAALVSIGDDSDTNVIRCDS